jgi:hypothetical protein
VAWLNCTSRPLVQPSALENRLVATILTPFVPTSSFLFRPMKPVSAQFRLLQTSRYEPHVTNLTLRTSRYEPHVTNLTLRTSRYAPRRADPSLKGLAELPIEVAHSNYAWTMLKPFISEVETTLFRKKMLTTCAVFSVFCLLRLLR